jgi:hypothetical protein
MNRAPEEGGLREGALYVYGIVPAGARPALEGAPSVEAGRSVELLGTPPLGVLVSRVSPALFANTNGGRDDDLAWLEAPVRAHQEVLERALAAGPVIPMRFGTVVSDEASLVAYVDERRDGFLATLGELEGKREWGVKVLADDERLREGLHAEAEPGAPLPPSEGAAYLARKRDERRLEERVAAYATAAAEAIHRELTALADRAATVAQTIGPSDERRRLLLNAAYLVDAQGEAAFRAAAEELGRRHAGDDGIAVALSGPWPPYSFVADRLER